MAKYTNEQYNEVFDKLPQEIKDAVASYDTTQHLWKIGEKRNLHIDKIGIMVDLTFDTMMGIIATKNFAKELQTELQIDALDASTLARDIDENVFKPIKSIMTKLYGDGAPYKPSSSLVSFYEEEDDHKALDKDSLLKEIENPAPAVSKIEQVVTISKSLETMEEVSAQKDMEAKFNTPHPSPLLMKELEAAPVIQPANKTVDAGEVNLVSGISNTLDRIASLKLSKTFVMPRRSEEVGEVQKSISTEEHKVDSTSPLVSFSASKLPEKAAPASKPYTPPAAKSYASDPYREPLV